MPEELWEEFEPVDDLEPSELSEGECEDEFVEELFDPELFEPEFDDELPEEFFELELDEEFWDPDFELEELFAEFVEPCEELFDG